MSTEVRKGIGCDGKTLKQMLDESDRLTKETGFYHGLKELPLTKGNPLGMEVFSTRLVAGLQSALETTRMIAASPIMREVAEICCGLYTPEGHCIAQSTGMSAHVPVMGQIIDWMIKQNYEEEVGINEGDLFCCNENVIAGFHAADVADIAPIFYKGELVAWAGTTCMEAEIGAIAPGTLPGANTERFTDGMRIYAEKIGTNDLMSKTFETRCKLGLRMPDLFLLDRRGAIAANLKTRDEVKSLIEEVGLDQFRQACRELIAGEEREQAERIRMRTVPGRIRNVKCLEEMYSSLPVPPIHRKDQFVLMPMELDIGADGEYTLDFDGTGAWGWHPTNCQPSAILGALSVTLVCTIAYQGRANSGTLHRLHLKVPYDTLVWPSSPYIATALQWTPAVMMQALFMTMQCRAFFSRGFREEIMLGGVSGGGLELGGKNQWGMEPFGFFIVDSPGTGGGGACAIRDGLDSGFASFLTEPDMGNIEVWETLVPLLWLGREMQPNWCAHGKYRGGFSVANTLLLNKTPYLFIGVSTSNSGNILLNDAAYGGFPVPLVWAACLKDPNIKELVGAEKPLIHEIGDPRDLNIRKLKGKLWGPLNSNPQVSDDIYKDGDLIQVASAGWGGGYGDPIERDLSLVQKDLDSGLMTPEVCRNVYCVEAKYDQSADRYVIDVKKTEELRKSERKERMGKMPAWHWWKQSRQKLIDGELPQIMKQMYNDSLKKDDALPQPFNPVWNTSSGSIEAKPKGQRWPAEFRAFWHLPENFAF